jgi:Flp pilus assembly protein TadD
MRLQGREPDAEATLREGLAVAPGAAPLHYALGLSLVRQQRKAEALRELRRATELDPANRQFRYVYDLAEAELR